MSRLLVVVTRDGALDGVLADVCEVRDGVRVFLRGATEVLRAPEGLALVVRSVPAQRLSGHDLPSPQEESLPCTLC